ncbi:MAG: hypothetical protein AAB447_03915 [Patescibacteria group bacterium]
MYTSRPLNSREWEILLHSMALTALFQDARSSAEKVTILGKWNEFDRTDSLGRRTITTPIQKRERQFVATIRRLDGRLQGSAPQGDFFTKLALPKSFRLRGDDRKGRRRKPRVVGDDVQGNLALPNSTTSGDGPPDEV